MKFFEIFKAGTYPQGKFTKEQIEEIAKNYDPSFCEAPITLDHEQSGPAFGWVESVKADKGVLKATFKDVTEDLKTFVNDGKYRKISVEIYRELEGKKPYLKAVSFLGASIPQVKGMEAVQFKEGESDVYTFEVEPLKEDKPDEKEIQDLKNQVNDLEGKINTFKEKESSKDIIVGLKTKVEELTDELATFSHYFKTNEDFAKQSCNREAIFHENKFSEKEGKEKASDKDGIRKELDYLKNKIRDNEFDNFVEKQLEKGILIPANKDVVLKIFKELDNVKKFDSTSSAVEDFKTFVSSLPKQIEFEEVATKKKATTTPTAEYDDFSDASEESLEIFNEANALAEKENIDFKDALLKLNKGV